ncbi:YutD family protein [Lysinibacillus sp. MHQ-1]|nr:YutD family protein [Lysinibacillus sp. MHQ-1]
MIIVEGLEYELLEDFREAFQEEVFQERYSDILARYDYIVGDWGYNQLRLKGFF